MTVRSAAVRLAVAAMLAFAAARPFAPPPTSAPDGAGIDGTSPAPATGGRPAVDPRVRRGCDLVAEYLGVRRPDADSACTLGPAARGTLDPPMLVVLPDPVDSRLDWAFDGGLESVRRAYERTGYVLDRFWLPWASDADSLHARGANHDAPDATLRRSYPGVLLFKRVAAGDDGPDEDGVRDSGRVQRRALRLVYVLGEVATGGVNATVFDSAVAERRRVLAAAGDSADAAAATHVDTLRVVGPVFSGSVRSIVRRLRAWADADVGRRHAVIVSGAATAAANKVGVDATTAGRYAVAGPSPSGGPSRLTWGGACVLPDPEPAVDFWATANPVDSVLSVTRRLLRADLGIEEREMAVLRESSTAFGAAASGAARPGADPGRPFGPAGACVAPPRDTPAADWLELPFPMNIARLRGSLLRTLAAAPTLPGAPQPGRTALDLQDPATARENLPSLSGLSAAAAERTLEDIVQTLVAHRVRAVVIVASDVRDRVFLANEVRTRLRDVKVVVVGAHSLYLRPEVNQVLRGTLVASTYPLFLESQFWDASAATGRQRFAFTGDLSEGTFNAALVQLGEGTRVIDYTYPFAGLGSGDTLRVPAAARTPPVWITVVGRAAMLPVHAVSLDWTPAVLPDTGGASAHWYVVPRPRGALAWPLGTATVRPAGEPPSEVARADLSTIDDWMLAALLAGAAVSAFAGFRVSDGAAPFGFGTRARAVPLPVRWVEPSGAAGTAEADAARADAARVAAVRGDRLWARPLLELELHAVAWTLLRHAALVGTVTPVILVLCRGRIHGAAAAALPPWALTLVAAAIGAALVWEDLVRVRGLVRGYGRALGPLAVRPAVVCALALAYAVLSVRFGFEVLAGAGSPDASPEAVRAASAVFATRALQLGSGVSPLAPLFVGGLLLLASAAWHLARVRQLREVTTFEGACTLGRVAATGCAGDPLPAAAWRERAAGLFAVPEQRAPAPVVGSARAFAEAVGGLRAQLIHVVPTPAGGLLVALLLALVGWMAFHIERTPETLALGPVLAGRPLPSTFDLLFRFVLASALTLGAWTLFRFVGTWGALRQCLNGIAGTGLVAAFGRLPRLLPELSRLTPFSMPPKPVADAAFRTVGRDGWAALQRAHPETADALVARIDAAAAAVGMPPHRAGGLPLPFGCNDPTHVRALAGGYGVLLRAAELGVLAPDVPDPAPPGPPPKDSARAAVQELAALYVVDYVEWVVRHLRRLAFGIVATLVLATVLLSAYPFEPQSLVRAALFVLMAASVAALLATLVQMNRDPVLSAITHTDPGKVTWDTPFVVNLLLVGAVPVLTLLGTQFSEARDFLFSWVTPILRTIGRN